jgi:CRP/FNR family cyclic AMP-dependent transcriptional regulator
MPSTVDVKAVLKKVQMFHGLTDNELDYVSRRASVKEYDHNQLVFTEGEPCTGLYVVADGTIRIFKTSPNGREQVLGVEGPGSSVAELPVFDGGSYPASVSSLSKSKLIFISRKDFQALVLEHPEVALKVLKVVGARLRRLVGIIEELSFTTVRHRLAAHLLRLAKTEGSKTADGVSFALSGSQQELASHIGTVRELVSRNLSRLQAEGIISLEAKSIVVTDMDALQAIVDSPE